jgi:hypothetical protein
VSWSYSGLGDAKTLFCSIENAALTCGQESTHRITMSTTRALCSCQTRRNQYNLQLADECDFCCKSAELGRLEEQIKVDFCGFHLTRGWKKPRDCRLGRSCFGTEDSQAFSSSHFTTHSLNSLTMQQGDCHILSAHLSPKEVIIKLLK